MPQVSPQVERMPRSGIRKIMDAAWASGKPFVGMHVGEPDFIPPKHVLDAGSAAYLEGQTHYVSNVGIPELRAALADKLARVNRLEVTPDQIAVTASGTEALFAAYSAILTAGDEVLIPDPGWPNYTMAMEMLQCGAVPYRLEPEHDFVPQIDALDALVTERTRAILVNSPSNPLGTVYSAETLEALVRFAERHDIWLISDECYDALTFGVEHVSPAVFDTKGLVISTFSFSKTYAMTGVRVGYLVGSPELLSVVGKLQETILACVNTPAQLAAVAALTGPQDCVEEMRSAYERRRDLAVAELDRLSIPYVRPDGAFYLWIDVTELAGDLPVDDWALRLLEEERVAVAPGSTFGASGEGWVRLALAASDEEILAGIAGIGRMLAAVRADAAVASAGAASAVPAAAVGAEAASVA
ncbi:pyridoxal phosphate-dependent aminotransferase [Demequina zhanjiangensis]|uniref:Pyridoxal phosphate-dependent aminotransferase n=1 Tax=Demequina zhanjiangensis TaxID=3051659 RepID=A0ABT8FZ60_9MICO|nr:pyridoxal phosphate-dependent aminotransferase [Demequina sp. SYSU T00b26]MDN4472184.1 pyridoxal phosphate-dependent aminotransferase [Demequina sp. SYSU T00b26]